MILSHERWEIKYIRPLKQTANDNKPISWGKEWTNTLKIENMDMKIGYSTMIVDNMDESVRFYTEIMGFEVDSTYEPGVSTKITLLKGRGETMLELIEDSSFPAGLYSIGMDVKDLDTVVEKMRSAGVEIMTEITPTLVGRMAMIKDPNGIRYALIEHK